MKYEEWIVYERARLEQLKREETEWLEREEQQPNQSSKHAYEQKPISENRGPIPPKQLQQTRVIK